MLSRGLLASVNVNGSHGDEGRSRLQTEMSPALSVKSVWFLVAFLVSAAAAGQTAKIALNPRASYIDVKARRSELKHTRSKRVRTALADLKTCSSLPVVATLLLGRCAWDQGLGGGRQSSSRSSGAYHALTARRSLVKPRAHNAL